MPAYHSTFQVDPVNDRFVGNFVLLPLNTTYRGPAYSAQSDYDIIDECLDLFRANSFFKNFEIKSPSDRVLIYGILYINDCLTHLNKNMSFNEAQKALTNLSLDSNGFKIPGDIGFPLNNIYTVPKDSPKDIEILKQYLQQFRQELAMRLLKRCYADSNNPGQLLTDGPSKYWLAFQRRKFMNKSL